MFYEMTTYEVNPVHGSLFEETMAQVLAFYLAQPGVNMVRLVKRTHLPADERDVLLGEPPIRIARPISGFCYALFAEMDAIDTHTRVGQEIAKKYGAAIDKCLISDCQSVLGEAIEA